MNPSPSSSNFGEMTDADAVGTAGSPGCGDMMKVWLKFRDGQNGERLIEKASFQGFGCETAIAVAEAATRLLEGRTVQEAMSLSGEDLSQPLGPLPPMKIHCATLVEEALRQALGVPTSPQTAPPEDTGALNRSLSQAASPARIVFLPPTHPHSSKSDS